MKNLVYKFLIAAKSPAAWVFAITGAVNVIEQAKPCLPSGWVPYANDVFTILGIILGIILHVTQVHEALLTPPPSLPTEGPMSSK